MATDVKEQQASTQAPVPEQLQQLVQVLQQQGADVDWGKVFEAVGTVAAELRRRPSPQPAAGGGLGGIIGLFIKFLPQIIQYLPQIIELLKTLFPATPAPAGNGDDLNF